MQNRLCPFSDDYMTFDKTSGHYVLTEKAITDDCGINIRARLEDNSTFNPDTVINRLLNSISDTVYAFIHDNSAYPQEKDCLIARSIELRQVMKKAMEYQAEYVLINGNLFTSTEDSDSGKELSRLTKSQLLNGGLLYSGA